MKTVIKSFAIVLALIGVCSTAAAEELTFDKKEELENRYSVVFGKNPFPYNHPCRSYMSLVEEELSLIHI